MTVFVVIAYALSCFLFFYFIVKNKKKVWGYLDKEDIFWLISSSLVYPLVVIAYLVYNLFNWLEVVINET